MDYGLRKDEFFVYNRHGKTSIPLVVEFDTRFRFSSLLTLLRNNSSS